MMLSHVAVIAGLILLVWSADRFVAGSASTAQHYGMPPLLIGMVVVGFGTSMPEMVVSSLAASGGQPGIALGNAYGSNITNIALILGITALISPILVHSDILRRELPILAAVTALALWQLRDFQVTRTEAGILLLTFAALMGWTLYNSLKSKNDALGQEMEQELEAHAMPLRTALFWLIAGLLVLVASSRLLVWGAVSIASHFGVSDLIIGLTIVAIGTSLPELASSVIAARKGEHDLALGNILGSNLFNTLLVVGVAGIIAPLSSGPEIFHRDLMVMAALTLSLFAFSYGFRGQGRINRIEGGTLLAAFIAYTAYLVVTASIS